MKVNNVEKFRIDLYDAIDEAYGITHLEEYDIIVKPPYDKNKLYTVEDGYEKYAEVEPDVWMAVTLQKPLRIFNSKIYMTVDGDGTGIEFWNDCGTHFETIAYVPTAHHSNRLSVVADVVRRLEHIIQSDYFKA